MASKGPKSDIPAPAASPPAVAKPVAAPKPVAAKPVSVVKPTTIAPVVPATPTRVPPALAATPVPAIETPAPAMTPDVSIPDVSIPAVTPAAALQKEEKIMEDTINTAANETKAQGQAFLADASDRAKSAMEKSTKMFDEMNEFSKGNVEAMVESTKIAAKGAEDILKYSAEYARATVEKANATASHFAAIKSPTELMKLQGDIAKEMLDTAMAEGAKFTENYLKLLGQITQPLQNRVALAGEKMKIAA